MFFHAWAASYLRFLSDWCYNCNVYGIIIGLDVGTELVSLDGSCDGSNYVNLEGLLLGGSLGHTDGKFYVSEEGIKLGSTGGKVLVTILRNVDWIIPGVDVATEMGSLDESFDGSNYGNSWGFIS